MRLTFVDASKSVVLSKIPYIEQESGVGGEWVLKDLEGSSNLEFQTGLGWKLVDSTDDSGEVVASGRTNTDAATGVKGNMVVPCETLESGKDYVLSVWGQEDGSDTVGWSNRATKPITGTVTVNGAGCSLAIRNSPSYGIALTGQTSGTLSAYKIGDYNDEAFNHTGALKSVMLTTPAALKDTLKNAAEPAGATGVDVDNPMGWVASRWLGYPTDPSSDDVTSAFSPYAGRLQLFAQALRDAVKADGDALGEVAGQLNGLDAPVGNPVTLPLSGPGLYLIVDSSGASLPIIVGTKVFNDALGEDGGFVDFTDAGVKGKPRLGQAALKTTVTDIAKRIVNDAGMDGFDVGSEVEYEIALQVPDLTEFSVPYDAYEFRVEDTADSGLTLPDASGVKVLLDTSSPDTDVTGALPSSSVTVSGQMLTLTGLKTLFADDNGSSGVTNKLPAGSLIRIRYTAVLNKEHATYAVPTSGVVAANMNEAKLTRSHAGAVSEGWTDAGSGVESKMVKANAYSFRVELSKRDKDDLSTTLVGARFKVLRDGRPLDFVEVPAAGSGVYRLAVAGDTGVTQSVETVADGKLTVQGVEARELVFEEIAAPSGYFKVSDFTVDVRPIWDADATLVTELAYVTSGSNLAYVSEDGRQVMVLDPAWSLANLPYTGGIGILVLLIVGGLILAFAIRPYILSKRAERDANLV
ncbi:isopeptide-forming domain-containing fimbrial protein [Bifidobacterium crudilactis]|uniref:isopeptide-forming domain-containing fimbrial protein n=1 Tax=Bifidobacterium crudilactis TaxID=327277 RepID=UPI00138E1445|nr:isopeptide-forming domain-containing fimbrial protein [Bifidobacterium crudilactis]